MRGTIEQVICRRGAEFDVAKVEFQKLRDELQKAAPDDRRVKVQQYCAQVENLKLAAAAVETAAMAEYRQQPNQNKQLVEWMVGYLKELISRDDYETAAEIAGMLIQQPFDLKPEVLGGVKAPDGSDQTVLERCGAGLAFFVRMLPPRPRLFAVRRQGGNFVG